MPAQAGRERRDRGIEDVSAGRAAHAGVDESLAERHREEVAETHLAPGGEGVDERAREVQDGIGEGPVGSARVLDDLPAALEALLEDRVDHLRPRAEVVAQRGDAHPGRGGELAQAGARAVAPHHVEGHAAKQLAAPVLVVCVTRALGPRQSLRLPRESLLQIAAKLGNAASGHGRSGTRPFQDRLTVTPPPWVSTRRVTAIGSPGRSSGLPTVMTNQAPSGRPAKLKWLAASQVVRRTKRA